MTDRDTFAAAALTGLLAQGDDADFPENTYWAAAYRMADAMLAFRDLRTADTTNHDAAPAAKAAKETLARGTDADGTGNTQGPVAWACFGTGYTHIAQHRELVEDSARVEGGYIVPLYRVPVDWQFLADEIARLRLTDEERAAVKLAADFLEDEFYGCSDKCAAEHNAVATLRKLLERMA